MHSASLEQILLYRGAGRGGQAPPPQCLAETRAEDYAHSRTRIFRPSFGPGLDYENSKVSLFDAVVAIKLCEKTKE